MMKRMVMHGEQRSKTREVNGERKVDYGHKRKLELLGREKATMAERRHKQG